MGNCGVGFAPARPTAEQHDWLIGLLEGVEDIPGTALAEGLPWDWETLHRLPRRARAPPLRRRHRRPGGPRPAARLRHGRAGRRPERVAHRRRAGRDGPPHPRRASTPAPSASRRRAPYLHRTRDGEPLGTRYSTADELTAIASALADAGKGVIQMISDAYLSPDDDFAERRAGPDAHAGRDDRPPAVDDGAAARRRPRPLAGDDRLRRRVRRRRPRRCGPRWRPARSACCRASASSINPFVADRRLPRDRGAAAGRAGAPAARPRAQGPHPARARGPPRRACSAS